MARPLRVEYPGAVYHVMARGNQGRAIFQDDTDRQRWLKTLEEACQRTGWRLHAIRSRSRLKTMARPLRVE